MGTNPIQRKSRNSFLLGVLISVVLLGAVIGFLLFQIINMKKTEDARLASMKSVYILKTDVKSGDSVSVDKLTKIDAEKDLVPSNAANLGNLEEDTVAKIDLAKGSVLTSAMIQSSKEATTDDLRLQEYNMISLSTQLTSDDYIDIRLRMPSGLDYIVISKKRVQIPIIGDSESENTIWLKLTEAETLLMSNAIVEAYMNDGALLYTTKYVEPGLQKNSTATYVPSANVQNLIYRNPNIEQEAKNALISRFNGNVEIRDRINGELSPYSQESMDKVKTGTTTEFQTTQSQRQAYLEALSQ